MASVSARSEAYDLYRYPTEEKRSDTALAWLVITSGPREGERVALYGDPIILGRAEDADVRLPERAISEHHARLFNDRGQWVVEDAGGGHDTFVNDLRIGEYALRDGDRIRIGRSILKLISGPDSDKRCQDELFRVSTHDALTSVGSRVAFREALARETGRARRYGRPLSLLRLDVDGFSALNQKLGDAGGSAILQMLCARLRPHLRRQDVVARVGDDEFAVLLPETAADELMEMAERLRARASADPYLVDGAEVRVSVSAGVATLRADEADEQLAVRARRGVDNARDAGGDRVGTDE